jgi:5-methylcytosine-specific restriction endonuclease McrA
MKTCLICLVAQPLDNFEPNKKGRGGLHPWCTECLRGYHRARYAGKPLERKPRPAQIVKTAGVPRPLAYVERAKSAWQKAKGLNRIPLGVCFEDVLPFYQLADRFKLEVDHIVPLQGAAVSGFHAPWNMQLLTERENIQKGNKF